MPKTTPDSVIAVEIRSSEQIERQRLQKLAGIETMEDVHRRSGSRPATADEIREFERLYGPSSR